MKRFTGWTITYRWDNGGWYAEVYDECGQFTDDSQKVWFPVDLDGIRHSSMAKVERLLGKAYPGAVVMPHSEYE